MKEKTIDENELEKAARIYAIDNWLAAENWEDAAHRTFIAGAKWGAEHLIAANKMIEPSEGAVDALLLEIKSTGEGLWEYTFQGTVLPPGLNGRATKYKVIVKAGE